MTVNLSDVPMNGVLLIDKEEGKSSFDVVRKVRSILKCKKTGHAGTLDPFATGLLVILLGQGTKLSPYVMGGKKKYLAEIKLGIETDTCDPTGTVIKETPVPHIGSENIEQAVQQFIGTIDQMPPAFSALKVNGQRAYKLARKGIEVELKKRKITIYSINIIEIRLPVITLEVTCSAGTYIRSLASDIGRELGLVAHLQKLRRLSSGLFQVDDALTSTDLSPVSGEMLLNKIIPLHESLPDMETINLEHNLVQKIMNGYRPGWKELTEDIYLPDKFKGYIKLIQNSHLAAVFEIDRSSGRENNWLKKVRVFH